MNRFYIPDEIPGGILETVDAELVHHLNVLHLKIKDTVVIFNGKGKEYTCQITELNKKSAILKVTEEKPTKNKTMNVTIACAIPKNARLDDIIDNLTQLGIESIIPMETERVIVKLDEAKKEERLKRWRSIARSASQQSGRNSLSLIEPIMNFQEVIALSADFDLKLIPVTFGARKHISQALTGNKQGKILVMIGPEGDFTPEEVETAKEAGFMPISLGETILRVATAAIAVVSFIKLARAD
jgi:16S rRNA (uracil1498-N3)-methyltransferase